MTSPEGVSKITRNFQVSIPVEVREMMDLKIGDFLAFYRLKDNGKIIIEKVSK